MIHTSTKHVKTRNQNTTTQDTIIRIHIISWIHRMLALVVASTALQSQLPMGFTLPLTRLDFKHLRSLSYQRLGSLATHTTWFSTLYVRLTDSSECQDVIITWILTKLYNEAPPRTSWNYVLSMRHHHELPLTGGHGIISWPMRHHHETLVELRPDQWGTTMRFHLEIHGITSWPHTKIMFLQPT